MYARFTVRILLLAGLTAFVASPAWAQARGGATFEPTVGQPGKDVVWVPTPQALVDKMLDMAKLTPQDYHMDLGSGDGRTVITAVKRGARSTGVEYNPDMVDLAKRNAAAAGVGEKAQFIRGDIFETDFSKAQVLTLFLLPSLNLRLRPTILNMTPGTRVVSNSFTMEAWQPDETANIGGDCTSWCTAHLWIVPEKVAGHMAARIQSADADAGVPDAERHVGHDARSPTPRCAAARLPSPPAAPSTPGK